jgi:hypothetical protein
LILIVILIRPFIGSGQELNTILMRSTFMIVGPAATQGQFTIGSVFVLGRPIKAQPGRARYVLITAAHVLDNINGESATLLLRRPKADGTYEKFPYEIKIRDKNTPLWIHHADAAIDVACMYLSLPEETKIPLVTTELLATDKMLEQYEIHPGDELSCLGYPLGAQANAAGFPILRSGKIASYPITPAKTVRSFLFDFRVFDGNSGGPVYFSVLGRSYGGSYHIDQYVQFIAGLVSQQSFATLGNNAPLQLAVIVPAQFIAETVSLLPEP